MALQRLRREASEKDRFMTNCGACIRFSGYSAENMWLGKCPVKGTNVSMPDPSCEAFVDQSILDVFQKLFIARSDCYAKQTGSGYVKVDSPLTKKVLQEHFRGKITIGAYQINIINNVKHLVFDLDPEKLDSCPETAQRLLLECIQKPSKEPRFYRKNILLEASRFNDPSYHIWVFFDPPIQAKVARWLAHKILEHAGLSPKTVEVFPKQDALGDDRSFGNLIKLPLGFHQTAKKWSCFLDSESFKPLPSTITYDVHGSSFSESDVAKILEYTKEQRDLQLKLNSSSVYPPSRMGKIRPCFKEALKEKTISHEMRVAIVTEFHRGGVSNTKDMVSLFRDQSDFDEKTTLYYVNDVVSRKYSRYKCETIKNFGYCIGTACPIFLRHKKRFERLVEAL